ncbi:MAG: hypothetical protein CVT62_12355 [Actinobacteria bacterium HGW-Actinobacteria-2]|nr:MAG: hypothetical protein CVT62_12355 [Actinobacteria bacterium HGW-Actinobacteria-2]
MRSEAKQTVPGAPYMSYKGFRNFLANLAANGMPDRFDGSYFGNVSGSLVAQIRGALRYLDLIDDDKRPTDLLKDLVEQDEQSQNDLLRMIFDEKYSDALALSASATSGQLAEVFRQRGLTGATVEKAIAFFLGMATDLGVELSPHYRRGRAVASSTGASKRRRGKVAPQGGDQSDNPPLVTVDAQKAAYVEMLMELAKKEGGEGAAQAGLLDRIEKALGIGEG